MLKPTIAISFLETFKDKNLDEIDMQIRHDAEIETGLSVDGLKEEEACSRLLSYIKESILSYDTEMVVYRNSHGCCNAFLSTALSKEDVDDFFFCLEGIRTYHNNRDNKSCFPGFYHVLLG